MIKVITSSSSKIGLVLFVFFVTIPVEVLARPLRPDLEVVQPLYNDHGPPKMYLKWSHPAFLHIQGIRFRKKVEGGNFGAWCDCGSASNIPPANHPCCEEPPEYSLAFACVDKSALSSGVRYTYQVQVKINDVWSYPSNFRSNKADKVWPVTDGPVINDECTGDESIGLMNGFNHVIQAVRLTHPYPHEGIDLRGEKAVPSADECVRAPVGGTISSTHQGDDYEKGIGLKFYRNGKKYYIGFNHLVYSDSLRQGTSVEPGQYLGKMATRVATSTGFQTLRPEQQHIHIDVEEKAPNLREGICRNPLEIWNNPVYRDPQGSPPEVADTNSDNVVVRFRKGPDTATYLPDDGNVYGPVDIVVEAWDHQSVENRDKPEAKFHPPLKIGYYIQRDDGNIITDVVRSADTPYLLIDGRNWFGYPYWYGMKLPLNQIKKLADVDDSLRCSIEDRFGYREWFTYIVTNTKGIDGILDDLSASQCWVTDAKNTETSPNGYRGLYLPELPEPLYSTYETARHNQEAKFPDGKYLINIHLEDYKHKQLPSIEPVIVDNFLPFVQRVTITSNAETIYHAGWILETIEGQDRLFWMYYAEPKDLTPGEALAIRVETSETMQDAVSVTLTGHTVTLTSTDSQGMVWEGMLVPSESDNYTLTIQGQDTADNPLLAFSETQPAAFPDHLPKPVPKRNASGDWPADYDALRQDTSGDTLHRLGEKFPPYVKTVNVTSEGEPAPLYYAGWELQENGHLEWVYYADSTQPQATQPLHITIVTSNPMQWISLTLFDQDFHSDSPDPTRRIHQADESGTRWEVTVDPVDFPQEDVGDDKRLPGLYPLIFRGQDPAGTPLLPFSERTPKPFLNRLWEWIFPPDPKDTVHILGAFPSSPPIWTMTTPSTSSCETVNGGVVCSLEESSGTSVGTGSVALGPKGFTDLPPEEEPSSEAPVVVLAPGDKAGLTHTGLYRMSEEELELRVLPRADWLEFCEGEPEEARCPESPKDAPGHKDPPELPPDTKALTWQMTIDTNQETETCQIQVRWETEDGQLVVSFTLTAQSLANLRTAGVPDAIITSLAALQDQLFPSEQTLLAAIEARIGSDALAQYHDRILTHVEQQEARMTLDVQPHTLCAELPAEDSGTVDVTATCAWEVHETTNYEWYQEPELVVKTSSGGNKMWKYLCKSCINLWWWLGPPDYYCSEWQEEPKWGQPPEDQHFDLIQPGEEGFMATQLVEVAYTECQWEEWPAQPYLWLKMGTWEFYSQVYLCVEKEKCPPYRWFYNCLDTGDCIGQVGGRNSCVKDETYQIWNGVWNCLFGQRVEALDMAPPMSVLLLPAP